MPATPREPLPPCPAGPRGVDADADLGLPGRADFREVVGEVVRRARVVGRGRTAVIEFDGQARHAGFSALIAGSSHFVIVPEIDVREHQSRHVQVVRDVRQVVDDRRRRERPRDLDAALARVELVGRQRRVRGAEVDLARRDRGDARARADRAVGDLRAGLRRVVGRPQRDERRDERAARAGEPVGVSSSRPHRRRRRRRRRARRQEW